MRIHINKAVTAKVLSQTMTGAQRSQGRGSHGVIWQGRLRYVALSRTRLLTRITANLWTARQPR